MTKPYAIISDTHNHNFSAFAETTHSGINSRLQATLDEFFRCAKTLHEAGGDTIYHTGDLFHVRGSIAPSVLNPTKATLEDIHRAFGINFRILAGNHDLEGKHSNVIGNAVEALRCPYVVVVSSASLFVDHNVLMIPWHDSIKDLKQTIHGWTNNAEGTTLMLHAPIDGVITGLPDHGLTAEYLRELGFKRVFSGHYHNHKAFQGEVYSVGALTHQTWGDVGTKAGFLIVTDDEVKWHCTHAPQFVDINGDDDDLTIAEKADGNFVRVKIDSSSAKMVNDFRDLLLKKGAKGVRIDVIREAKSKRAPTGVVQTGHSVEQTVASYIKSQPFEYAEQTHAAAMQLLAEANV